MAPSSVTMAFGDPWHPLATCSTESVERLLEEVGRVNDPPRSGSFTDRKVEHQAPADRVLLAPLSARVSAEVPL